MAKKKINSTHVDMDDAAPAEPVTVIESAEPEAEEAARVAAMAESDAPVAETEHLEPGEIIRGKHEEPVYSFRVGDVSYHHTRNAADGRWIYAPIRT